MTTALIEANQLSTTTEPVIYLDASFILSNQQDPQQSSADKAFSQCHIPNAQRFDLNRIADTDSDLPHMLPDAQQFSQFVGNLGIDNNTTVICYEQNTLMGAARAWWMFRAFGHEKVYVLNGGLAAYKSAGLITSSSTATIIPKQFNAYLQDHLVADLDMIANTIEANQFNFDFSRQIIDARGSERFMAQAPEPRAGLRSGHMPTALNLPFTGLFDQQGLFLSRSDLASVFASNNINPHASSITTCGSGVTACTVALAMYELGNHEVAIYDGSWAEWGADETLPISVE